MESLRELFIKLGLSVNGAEFAEGLAWEHALEKGADLVVEAVEWMGEQFVQAVEKTAQFGEQIDLLSIKTGASAEEIQKLGYAATLNGSSADAMGTALQRLARQMEEAKDGSEASQKHFSKLGISMAEVRSQSPDELFKTVADKLKGLGDAGKASATAMQIFGRQGKDLVPTLLLGRAGLEEYGQELEDLGGMMSGESIKAAREFEDSMKKIHAVTEGLYHQVGSLLIEGLQPVVKGVLSWVKANKELISQKLKEYAQVLVSAFKNLVEVAGFLIEHFRLIAMAIGSVMAAVLLLNLGYISLAASSVMAAVAAAAAWAVAAAPVVAIAAALLLAALMADDFFTFLRGGHSVIGEIAEEWGKFFAKWMTDHGDAPIVKDLKIVLALMNAVGSALAAMDPTGLLGRALERTDQITDSIIGPRTALTGSKEQMDAALGQAMAGFHGNAATPGASAESAKGTGVTVHAPQLSLVTTIVQGVGQSAGQVSDTLMMSIKQWWDSELRAVAPVAGK